MTVYDAGIDKTLAKLSVLRELGMRYLTFLDVIFDLLRSATVD